MAECRGRPLGGEELTLADTTDEALELPFDTYPGIRKVGIVADADVYVAIDNSAVARTDLATTGVLVTGGTPAVEAVFSVRSDGFFGSDRDTTLHIAASSSAGVHVNYYQ